MNSVSKKLPAILFSGGQAINDGTAKDILTAAIQGRPEPRVAYIGAANGDRESFFEMVSRVFTEAGAVSVDFVRLARDRVDTGAARETLSGASVIFLSGGEVEDGINHIKRHGLYEFMRELYDGGRQFIGVSAGSIMLGDYWVRWDTPGDDDTAGLFECLNIIPRTFDTHAEDEDWIELKTALRLMGDGARGYGIPRGGIISADSCGNLKNLMNEYLTFIYKDGTYEIS